MIIYPSSFIFIHDTFYIDYSLPNSQDISEPIREFMSRKKCFDPVLSRDIEGVKVIDLKLRLGQPYVFQHSGTCEHLLIFHDLRLLEKTDIQDLDRYPMVVFEKRGDVRCAACKRGYAAFVVEECERLPSPYMMFCDGCFRERAVNMTSRWVQLLLVRSFSNSRTTESRYDPRVFREPITNIEKIHQPLDENDERNFLFLKAMKSDETPVFYRDHTVDKLIRVFMKCGKKELCKKHVYAALEIIKSRQYKAWRKADEHEKKTIELDPFVIARKAIKNCSPLMKLQGVVRGGTVYQVPFPIEEAEAEFRAMKMMREICRQKAAHGEMHLKDILANELLSASRNEGFTIQAKRELHKTCEANRAYAHYRS
ncbi:ribosomal protein S7p/S5e [Dictyocaulus viviparus]|uniref:Small ribosomal subunit protein uS7m n=1 Tax=Dictyocaulus viviparus TaxID=29172 RepID=A0A0D8XWF8_DICVI|nr:ribosomal protein S7p/S5e [Dictyocaulus viviparus]